MLTKISGRVVYLVVDPMGCNFVYPASVNSFLDSVSLPYATATFVLVTFYWWVLLYIALHLGLSDLFPLLGSKRFFQARSCHRCVNSDLSVLVATKNPVLRNHVLAHRHGHHAQFARILFGLRDHDSNDRHLLADHSCLLDILHCDTSTRHEENANVKRSSRWHWKVPPTLAST